MDVKMIPMRWNRTKVVLKDLNSKVKSLNYETV